MEDVFDGQIEFILMPFRRPTILRPNTCLSCATLDSKALSRFRMVSRSCQSQIQRTPADRHSLFAQFVG